jgi:hypothetical protein
MSQKSKTNDQIILETIIQDKCSENNNELSYSEYFEIYSACEILKNHDLTYDDILYGIVGNGGDGGIDSIYTFVNGEQLKEDTPININTKKNQIELVIIQSKTSPNFKEEAIVKFRETAEDLFNLANKPEDYAGRYNKDLIDCVNIFRDAYSKLARTLPKILVRYFYVTQGTEVHVNVDGKVEKLKEDIQNLFNGSEFTFEFITASKLLAMTRDIPSTTRMLEVAESPIGTTSGSYLCLVNLYKYFEFICDNGNLARSIFESNVRDYQGSVIVNTGIRKTLENLASENFWYLNNGVTIITPKAVLAGKQLTIEDPQIVNGLQTSHEIYLHYSKDDVEKNDPRAVLVRVICEENEEARDRIIRATNSQTAIPPASLRSSDEIHRNIEDFLKNNDFYYDRKKNYYKNQGKSPSRIVSIPYMAQAMMAIILKKPDSARARPSTLINSDNEYKKIFSLDLPIDVYLKCIQIVKAVESYLKPDVCQKNIERKVITNIKYYVSMVVAIKLLDSKENMIDKLHELTNINISTELLSDATETVLKAYEDLGATDQVAKGTELVKILLS